MSTVHDLKTWPAYWPALESGAKTFEIRRNDRGFQPGDTLNLREWDPDTELYSGRTLQRRVNYVLRDAEQFGLQSGYTILGMGPVAGITEEMIQEAARVLRGCYPLNIQLSERMAKGALEAALRVAASPLSPQGVKG